MDKQFVQVIFPDDVWEWLQQHLSDLEETEMVLKALSAVDDGMIVEEDD